MKNWWARRKERRRPVALIFRWKRPHGFSFRLGFFLLLSFALHVAGFYLFKVVYPPNQKALPRAAEVWQLPADDPRVLAQLARHGTALGAFAGAIPIRESSPATTLVPLRLSFDGYSPSFVALPPRQLNQPLEFPDAVPALLPPVEELTVQDQSPMAARDSILWEDPATGTTAELPWTCPENSKAGTESVWQARVDAAGRVIEVVPVRSPGGAADAGMRRHLLTLSAPATLRPPAGGTGWLLIRLTACSKP